MITLKASVAAAILVGTTAATAGATYAVTRMSVAVSCPPTPAAAEQSPEDGWRIGPPVRLNEGKTY